MTQAAQATATGQKDSLIGICAAIGEDFGFNPDILRVGLATGLLFVPMIVFGFYVAAGAVVLLSRVMFPARRRATAAVVVLPAPAAPQPEPERMLEAA
ncbi:PspC domain-containing protein [Sphingomonas sp.]|uniref:PspC domain-containing protein n=1 Tax=Sphingomonas sp. TaxID=28214 RepID=UPI003B002038